MVHLEACLFYFCLYEQYSYSTLSYDVCTRTDHGVALLCYRTRAAEIEEKHNVNNALWRSWMSVEHYFTALRDGSSSANTILGKSTKVILDGFETKHVTGQFPV